jgi:hypothetical protein
MKKLASWALALSVTFIVPAFAPVTVRAANQVSSGTTAPVRTMKGMVKVDGDKVMFVQEEPVDLPYTVHFNAGKSWEVANPEKLKDRKGQHVEVTAHVYPPDGKIEVMTVKVGKAPK